MILLTKGVTNNNIALTLTELTTIVNVTYLFEFINDLSNVAYYFIGEDTSLHKKRYNQFSITEGINDPLNGSIELGDVGFYSYKVYEQDGNSLNPEGLNVVEVGKMKLLGGNQEFKRNEQTTTFKIYEPS